ncbi:CLOCK-interacting pacemaker [Microcaecilia unicolor]|uniref:CLOCK-interacting pacemaker n=1 Tax=Microcaecilia unicolor TaxID=1415580 RepID=A0A6P7ZJA6_9AMPH|nr:CLOCK-interacting pacemaker [Microcaecilia unicolor]XP_030074984.1 CLOCK-interacting pacemaker [Microcaecilia unicolor]XP_030074985.1 CLOCK-interacting pacemaker [Microcaecilia unicolor]XP_030074986.1 CLOCK-interacting pacemaker [Microcaecilia unicolor]XP_030074987.1 CLOCK-interacting pacemaker [Microcaecilia unicolor]
MSLDDSLLEKRTTKTDKEKASMTACIKSENMSSEGYKGQPKNVTPNQHPCQSSGESEKDSGFSDTSWEDLSTVEQTDTEDQSGYSTHRLLNKEQPEKPAPISSTFISMTPIYIIKNVILKQPLTISTSTQFLHAPLTWNGQHALNLVQGQARVLFIQQPMATTVRPVALKRKLQAKDTYLPILNSYPKIAPHPDRNGDHTLNTYGDSKKKRLCVKETHVSLKPVASISSDAVLVQRETEQALKQALLSPLPYLKNLSSLTLSNTQLEPEMSISHNTVTNSSKLFLPTPEHVSCSHQSMLAAKIAEGKAIARASKKLASNVEKRHRFHNTVDILKKSGLLGITLKTKDLIRQNSSSQRDISELKEHTQLFCEAMQTNTVQAWVKLQEVMNASTAYWDKKGSKSTKNLQDVKFSGASVPKQDTNSHSVPTSLQNLSLTTDSMQTFPAI